MIIETSSFSKSSVFKMFSSTLERKLGVLKFLRFEDHFQNAACQILDELISLPSFRNDRNSTLHSFSLPTKNSATIGEVLSGRLIKT